MNYSREGPPIDITPGLRGLQTGGSISAKVGEVFLSAGYAFQKLGDLTLQLNSATESQENMKWTDVEMDMLKSSLDKFAQDLENISTAVQQRTTKQVKMDLKRKSIQDQQAEGGSGGLSESRRQGGPPPAKQRTPGGYADKRGRPLPPSKSYAAANTPRNIPPPGMSVYSMAESYGSEIGPPQF